MSSFDKFLRTGQLGQVAVGMTKDDLRALLGDPPDTSVRKHPEIWKYGPVELSFYPASDGLPPSLTSISYHFRHDEPPEPTVALSGWLPTHETTFDEFRAHLEEMDIPVHGGVAAGPRQHLVIASAVRIAFDEGHLRSVSYAATSEAERKQLSIMIPRDGWRALDREAKSRGISASALCSRWIGEHLMSLKGQEA